MEVVVKFEDNDHEYVVNFLKLAKKLGITEDQVKQAVQQIVSTS